MSWQSAGVRRVLVGHEVRTFYDMQWDPQLENGALLNAAEEAGFDAMVISDQNIKYQQIVSGRRLTLVLLASKPI